jgi:hypothetical protein
MKNVELSVIFVNWPKPMQTIKIKDLELVPGRPDHAVGGETL